jgi:hypothetical protein
MHYIPSFLFHQVATHGFGEHGRSRKLTHEWKYTGVLTQPQRAAVFNNWHVLLSMHGALFEKLVATLTPPLVDGDGDGDTSEDSEQSDDDDNSGGGGGGSGGGGGGGASNASPSPPSFCIDIAAIGRAFSDLLPYLRMYTTYLNGYPAALKTIHCEIGCK